LISEIQRSLRKLKPEKRLARLKPRPRSQLEFLDPFRHAASKLLLDTTVYIDVLQGRFPRTAEVALRASELWHSTVAESELIALAGLLDPRHPETRNVVAQLVETLVRRPTHRILNPDAEVWREAGILAGTLARLQQYNKSDRRRSLNDALILLSAAKSGCTVLTRNLSDFDLLTQLVPSARVVFYSAD
jgi:predicted nucleic acid-binding protein